MSVEAWVGPFAPRISAYFMVAALLGCGADPSVSASGASATPAPPVSAPSDLGEAPSLPDPERFAASHAELASYWYQGKAELVRYALSQSRYGETREGEAVFIFVTEPFDPDAQVKREHGEGPTVSVLKLNQYRRFQTGIYPYTITTSTFLPLHAQLGDELGPRSEDPALKVASSVIEWCGVAYAQLNRRTDTVDAVVHSYFQDEGDQSRTLPADVLFEDAVFGRIRRDPDAVPVGELTMVPAMHFLRMRHQPLRAYAAEASLSPAREGVRTYEVRYPELGRRLVVQFTAAFPHVIERFEEHEPEIPPTIATRTHAILDDYWNHHGNEHAPFRLALGL